MLSRRFCYFGLSLCRTALSQKLNQTTSRSFLPRLDTVQVRGYAKGKDKKKEVKNKKIHLNEKLLEETIPLDKCKSDMESHLTKMHESFVTHLSLRSSTSIDHLIVTVDGTKYPLIELAQIVRNNPKTLVLNMMSFPQAIPSVLKALADSGMNLNPQQDGTTLFVPIPKVTKEHRENLAKGAKAHFIKCRDGVRRVQTDVQKKLKEQVKDGLSEDVCHQVSEQIKFLADQYIEDAEKMFQLKQKDLLGQS